MTRLETARLTLRPLELDDLDDFAEMMSHPDVYPMMGFGREPDGTERARTLEERRPRIAYRVAQFQWEGFGEWAVVMRETGAFAGMVGLQFYPLDQGAFATPEVELFYGLKREWWDHGIMREATEAIVRYAIETLKQRRLTSVCFSENERSANVMCRVGMTGGPHPGNPDGEMLDVL
ncbi:MAG TPA: GNAT family N-acetyltransferase, partial [Ktedonobacterales bacterium]|nr:GNAT family N-acetyltransferase [Ktedonobacterales bacterium]